MRRVILNKYRNELGKKFRRLYDSGVRNDWCKRSNMRSYMPRPDLKFGTLTTFASDNLVMGIYEKCSDCD